MRVSNRERKKDEPIALLFYHRLRLSQAPISLPLQARLTLPNALPFDLKRLCLSAELQVSNGRVTFFARGEMRARVKNSFLLV